MRKFRQAISFMLLGMSLFLSGCSTQFCSFHCVKPSEAPEITQNMVDDFAKQAIQLMPKGDLIKIVLPADTFFRHQSPTLKNDKKPALTNLAVLIRDYGPTATVQVLGFTDTIPSNEEGKKLSLARARAVLVYLWAQGLDADHLYALGYGSSHLVADPSDVSANEANRRVEIIIHAHCTTCF